MIDHRETAADGVYHMILYNLLCFASVLVFIFGRAARKVAEINFQNPIAESCHDYDISYLTDFNLVFHDHLTQKFIQG